MEAFETAGKGGPTWMRKQLFQRILASLREANGEKVKLSSFVATISIGTGLKRKTVAEMIVDLSEASIVELNEEENYVRLVGGGA